jgi:hypothetical protein
MAVHFKGCTCVPEDDLELAEHFRFWANSVDEGLKQMLIEPEHLEHLEENKQAMLRAADRLEHYARAAIAERSLADHQ